MQGWIKLHRKLTENDLWTCEPFTRGQAWVDLLLLANHEYGYFYKRGVKIEVQRGQVGVSEVGLSDRWKWSRSKVRKFLKDLEKEQQIKIIKSNVTQTVTINKYEHYQQKEQQSEQQKDSRRTPKEQQKDTNKNNKEEQRIIQEYKESKNLNGSFEEVVNLWLEYKKEKKQMYKPVGLKGLLKKLYDYSHGDSKKAMEIVEYSISNNYSGIFELKNKPKANTSMF